MTFFRYNPTFGHPGAGRHHEPDPGDGAVERCESSAAAPGCSGPRAGGAELRLPRRRAVGLRQGRPMTTGGGVVRHRCAQREGRVPALLAATCSTRTIANQTQLAIASTRACPMRSATGCRLGAATRSRSCTASSCRTVHARPPDAVGRAPWIARRATRRRTERHHEHVVPEPAADHDRADAGRGRVQRHHAARGRRLRRLRQRQDGAEVPLGQYLAYAANDPPYTSTNPGATVVRSQTATGPTAITTRSWTATC